MALPFIMMFVLGAIPFLFYVLWAVFQYQIARKWGHRNAWTAFVPIISQYQLFQLTKRPFWHMIIPILNIVSFIRMQSRLCRMNGERAVFQVYLFIPLINLWALHRLAKNKRIYIKRDDRLKRIKSLVPAIESGTPKEQIFVKARQAFMDEREIKWLYYLAETIYKRRLKVLNHRYPSYIPEILLVLWFGGQFLFPLFMQASTFLRLIPQALPVLSQQLEDEMITAQPFLICAQYQTTDSCNTDQRCSWGTDCPSGSGQCGLEVVEGPARCLPTIIEPTAVLETDQNQVENKSRPRPRTRSSKKPVIDTSRWKIYTNEEHQIELKYPADYHLNPSSKHPTAYWKVPASYKTKLYRPNITLVISNQISDLETFTETKRNIIVKLVGEKNIIKDKSIKILEEEGQEIVFTRKAHKSDDIYKEKHVWIILDNKLYMLIYVATVDTFKDYESDFDEMVHSVVINPDLEQNQNKSINTQLNLIITKSSDPLWLKARDQILENFPISEEHFDERFNFIGLANKQDIQGKYDYENNRWTIAEENVQKVNYQYTIVDRTGEKNMYEHFFVLKESGELLTEQNSKHLTTRFNHFKYDNLNPTKDIGTILHKKEAFNILKKSKKCPNKFFNSKNYKTARILIMDGDPYWAFSDENYGYGEIYAETGEVISCNQNLPD